MREREREKNAAALRFERERKSDEMKDSFEREEKRQWISFNGDRTSGGDSARERGNRREWGKVQIESRAVIAVGRKWDGDPTSLGAAADGEGRKLQRIRQRVKGGGRRETLQKSTKV